MPHTPYIVIHQPHYSSAFRLDPDTGELMETVEFNTLYTEPIPLWDEGGPCDPIRGSNPDLQRHIIGALKSIQKELVS